MKARRNRLKIVFAPILFVCWFLGWGLSLACSIGKRRKA